MTWVAEYLHRWVAWYHLHRCRAYSCSNHQESRGKKISAYPHGWVSSERHQTLILSGSEASTV